MVRPFFALFIFAFACCLLAPAPVQAGGELTVYCIPAPRDQDWSSPRGLLFSGVKSRFSFRHLGHKHFIGHAFMELKGDNYPEHILTGMTTTGQTEETNLVLKYGYCLGVLFANLHGKFDASEKLAGELPPRYKSGLVSFITFKLNDSQEKYLFDYFNRYRDLGCMNFYGGANRPLYGEGGGCSAFAFSFIEALGQMREDWKKDWQVHLRVPAKLIGGPLTGNSVSAFRVFTSGRWARPDEPHVPLSMWDPTLFHHSVRSQWETLQQHPDAIITPILRGKARGLLVDCRNLATPQQSPFMRPAAELSQVHGTNYAEILKTGVGMPATPDWGYLKRRMQKKPGLMERALIRRVESLFDSGSTPDDEALRQTVQQLDELQGQ